MEYGWEEESEPSMSIETNNQQGSSILESQSDELGDGIDHRDSAELKWIREQRRGPHCTRAAPMSGCRLLEDSLLTAKPSEIPR